MINHHKPKYLVKGLICCLQGQGHSKGSKFSMNTVYMTIHVILYSGQESAWQWFCVTVYVILCNSQESTWHCLWQCMWYFMFILYKQKKVVGGGAAWHFDGGCVYDILCTYWVTVDNQLDSDCVWLYVWYFMFIDILSSRWEYTW